MKTEHCHTCNQDLGWVLFYDEHTCAYCTGVYPDNKTKCSGGSDRGFVMKPIELPTGKVFKLNPHKDHNND